VFNGVTNSPADIIFVARQRWKHRISSLQQPGDNDNGQRLAGDLC